MTGIFVFDLVIIIKYFGVHLNSFIGDASVYCTFLDPVRESRWMVICPYLDILIGASVMCR